ncbi:hypothetical protein Efla_006161 [Eimeria flavescens]
MTLQAILLLSLAAAASGVDVGSSSSQQSLAQRLAGTPVAANPGSAGMEQQQAALTPVQSRLLRHRPSHSFEVAMLGLLATMAVVFLVLQCLNFIKSRTQSKGLPFLRRLAEGANSPGDQPQCSLLLRGRSSAIQECRVARKPFTYVATWIDKKCQLLENRAPLLMDCKGGLQLLRKRRPLLRPECLSVHQLHGCSMRNCRALH